MGGVKRTRYNGHDGRGISSFGIRQMLKMRVRLLVSVSTVAALLVGTSIGRNLLAQAKGPLPGHSNSVSVHHPRGACDTPELALVAVAPTLAAPDMVAGFTMAVAPTAPAHFAASPRAGRAPPTV